MSDLRFTAVDLRRLAGDAVFKRGEAYVRESAVRLIEVTPERVEAEVTGSELYDTTLSVGADGEVSAECSCPHGEEGNFCKHAVAVGLVMLAQPKGPRVSGVKKESDKEVLAKHLAGLSRDVLEARLLKAMEDHAGLRRALLSEAIAARTSAGDKDSWRRLIETAFRATRTMGWESSGDFPEALDGLESAFRGALSPATAPVFLDFLEEIVARGEEATGGGQYDPEGEVVDALGKLGALHRDACGLADLAPEVLATRLFKLETRGGFEFVSFGPGEYEKVLGAEGLRFYRELVEDLFVENPPGKNEWALHNLRAKLAELCGDFDGRIAILEKNGAAASHIVKLLREAGREAEALARAERARREDKHGPGDEIIAYLIESYSKAGRHADALAVALEAFERSPALSGYKRVVELARLAGGERETRAAALAVVADPKHRRHHGFYAVHDERGRPDNTLRIEIALWENDPVTALAAADAGVVASGVLTRLAEVLAPPQPAEAIRLRERLVNALLLHTDAKTYPAVAAHVEAMRDVFRNAGLAREFDGYLRELREKHKAKRSLMAQLAKVV